MNKSQSKNPKHGIRRFLSRFKHFLFLRRYLFKYLLPLNPVSREFGYERGTPLDRYYIDHFFEKHRDSIRGDVLEVGDSTYTDRFSAQVKSTAILHYEKEVSGYATIVGDMEHPETLPRDRFDCFICPQTFHFIYELDIGVKSAYQVLKKGGVLLATFPCISQGSVGKQESWKEYWRFQEASLIRGFSSVFGKSSVEVTTYGNVLVAASFLYGFSWEEIPKTHLDYIDPAYPFLITVKAVKG